MRVLVVNAGSSSLKLRLLDQTHQADQAEPADQAGRTVADRVVTDRVVAGSDVDSWDGRDGTPVARFVERAGPVDVVGHRIVHGGAEFTGPVRVDATVRDRIAALTDLAPLHQPRTLAALDAAAAALPGTAAVACFDTAFHAGLPAAAASYALPAGWRDRWSLRRYGFHGLSHGYASRRAVELLDGAPRVPRVVSCHLGAGASLAAVHDGRSVDTTMGFTPLEGLVMATRSGNVDPGLVLWLADHTGLPAAELSAALYRDSGLAGLSGQPGGDLRAIRAAAGDGDEAARLAVAVYTHRLRAQIAAMCAAMGGMNVLVFTGGVGEHDHQLRRDVVTGVGFLGAAVDPQRNRQARSDAEISAPGAPVRTVVVTAREDLEIARQARAVLSEPG